MCSTNQVVGRNRMIFNFISCHRVSDNLYLRLDYFCPLFTCSCWGHGGYIWNVVVCSEVMISPYGFNHVFDHIFFLVKLEWWMKNKNKCTDSNNNSTLFPPLATTTSNNEVQICAATAKVIDHDVYVHLAIPAAASFHPLITATIGSPNVPVVLIPRSSILLTRIHLHRILSICWKRTLLNNHYYSSDN